MNIYQKFLSNYKKEKHKVFINFEEKKYSYEYVLKKIQMLENNFFKGRTINSLGIISHNKVDHVILYLFCSKHKIMFVPFDPDVAIDDLSIQIRISKCKHLFCSNLLKKNLSEKISFKINFYNFLDNINVKQKINKKFNPKKNIFFLLCFTSGSTGNPKPIAISEKTKYMRAKSNIKIYNLSKSKRSLITTPFHHTLAIRILTMSIIMGAEIFVIENYYSDKLIKVIQDKKINFTLFVSNQINSILINPKNFNKLQSLKALISSSSNLSLKNKKKILKNFKGKIFECYGLSEAAIVSNLNLKKNKNYLDSVGKSIEGVDIKIINKDKNGIGEIAVKSKFIFSEYFNRKKYSKAQFVNNNYFLTGDLGYLRKNFLYLVGRKKNMIKVKGISVYGEDIEKKIINSGLVKECLVASAKNKFDEEIICLIYTHEKNLNIDNKVKNYSLDNLSSFQIPRHYIKLNSIPKNKMGKLDKTKIDKILNEYIKSLG